MKTATIRVNTVFGAKGQFCAEITYFRKELQVFLGTVPNDLLAQARKWAHANGFTHTNITFG